MSIWFLVGTALVFFMQCGFTMVEAGFTRAKNAGNIIMKNFMDFCLGAVAFLAIGFSLLCGDSVFGLFGWGANPLFDFNATNWAIFAFNLMFCATTATIVSGAVAERTKFSSYCIYSIVLSAIVYPIEAHWVWGTGGFLLEMGFHDFAGSAAIHTVGGISALIGAKLVGARIGKFDKNNIPKAMPGHSLTLAALGVFILWFGWYGFNGAAASDSTMLAEIFATTTIAPALATVTVMAYTWLKYGKPDVGMTLNGSLAGLVAITAGCDVVDALGAAIIGVAAAFVVIFVVWFLDYKLRIDDPVGAVAVHGGCGILGTICVGLFAIEGGLFYGGGFDYVLVQLYGILVISLWTAITMGLVFLVIKKTIGLRVSEYEEIVGLDKEEHGLESAYAGFAFETQYLGGASSISAETFNQVSVEDHRSGKEPSAYKLTKIVVITKPEKFNIFKEAMDSLGISGMTVTKVLGCGVQKGRTTYYRGAKVDMLLLEKIKVEIVVSQVPVQDVVDAARKVLCSQTMGDGKIFIYDVENVVRISSGEQGVAALQYSE